MKSEPNAPLLLYSIGCRRQLKLMRQFYWIFPIANAVRSQLNWTQYQLYLPSEQALIDELNKELEKLAGDEDEI